MGFALLWRSKLPSNQNEGKPTDTGIQERMEFVS